MRIIIFITSFTFLCACSNEKNELQNNDSGNLAEKNIANKKDSLIHQENDDAGNLLLIDNESLMIQSALLAAPEEIREQCKVLGYDQTGKLIVLKEGTNEFTCLADDPNQKGFNAACYHNSLAPFMKRGRELKAEGKNRKEIFDIREHEVKTGKLQMAEAGATLHIYFGDQALFDPNTGNIPGAKYRYVVYLPFATVESTGLPEKPIASNHPWIMNPGTHKAHIMISPLSIE
jgi:hypothetical protein